MKKTAYYYLSLAAIVAGGLVSCQDENQGFTKEEISYAKFEKEYNENFEKDYGKIAPGHTWGFEMDTKANTRATDGTSSQYKLEQIGEYKENKNDGSNTQYVWKCKPACVEGTSDLQERIYAGENYPGIITQAERDYVFKYIQDHPNEGSTTCELGSYFLQDLGQVRHIYKSTPDNNGTIHDVQNNMEELVFDQVHFKDYNAGSGKDYYVTNTDILSPQYKDTYGSSYITNRYRYYYIPGYGCYLCFDYESKNKDDGSKVIADGIYDDWVIKVYPGENDLGRVFCEDLGSTLDLDFNDLVFDYCNYGTDANPNVYIEVKSLLGTLPMKFDGIVLRSADDVTIHDNVDGPSFFINKLVTTPGLIKVKGDNNRFDGNSGWENNTWNISNNPGRAPYMLRVAPNTAWTEENQRIDDLYPGFKPYVVSPDSEPNWWKKSN